MNQSEPAKPKPLAAGVMRKKALLNFGLFGVFFVFYVGTAVIQTPAFNEIAVIPALGMPLGLLLSLSIFPLSWVILAFWFWRAR